MLHHRLRISLRAPIPGIPSGPGPQNGQYDPVTDTGYYGFVPASDLGTGDQLATAIGLTAGVSQNSDAGWLKFYVGPNAQCNRFGNAYVVFVAKLALRNNVSWQEINAARPVDGTGVPVSTGGNSYKVRLLTGADANPSTFTTFVTECADDAGQNSEWNDLLYRVHEAVPNCSDPYEGLPVNEFSVTRRHGGPQVGKNWAAFSTTETGLTSTSQGSLAWCQEVDGQRSNYRVHRGFYGLAGYATGDGFQSNPNSSYGWRPTLQLVSN